MRVSNKFIATVVALFVLYTPLCALACSPAADDAPISMAEHAGPPCHAPAPDQASVPNSDPGEPTRSHDGCGCEEASAAVVSSTHETSTKLPTVAWAPRHALSVSLATEARCVPTGPPRETDLPPPDLLLVKSSLLI